MFVVVILGTDGEGQATSLCDFTLVFPPANEMGS